MKKRPNNLKVIKRSVNHNKKHQPKKRKPTPKPIKLRSNTKVIDRKNKPRKKWLIGGIFSILAIIIVIPITLYYTVGFDVLSPSKSKVASPNETFKITKTFNTQEANHIDQYSNKFTIVLLINEKEYEVPVRIGYFLDSTSTSLKEDMLETNDNSNKKAKASFKITLDNQEYIANIDLVTTNSFNDWSMIFKIDKPTVTKPSIEVVRIINQEDWLPITSSSSLFSYSYSAKLQTQSLAHLSEYPKEFSIPLVINSQEYNIPIKIGYLLNIRTQNNDEGVAPESYAVNHKQAETNFRINVNNKDIDGKIRLFSNSSWNNWDVKVTFENQPLENPSFEIKTKLEGNIIWSKIPNTIYNLHFDESDFQTTLGEINSSTIDAQLQQGEGIRVNVTINNVQYLYGILIGKFLSSGFSNPRIRKKSSTNHFFENVNVAPEVINESGLIDNYILYPWVQVIGSGDSAKVIITKVQWIKTKWDDPDLTKEDISFSVQNEILNGN